MSSSIIIEGRVDARAAVIHTAGTTFVARRSRAGQTCATADVTRRLGRKAPVTCHRLIGAGDVHVQRVGSVHAPRYCVACAQLQLGMRVEFRPGPVTRMTTTTKKVGRSRESRRARTLALAVGGFTAWVGAMLAVDPSVVLF